MASICLLLSRRFCCFRFTPCKLRGPANGSFTYSSYARAKEKIENALQNYEPYEISLRPFQIQSASFCKTFTQTGMVVGPMNLDPEGNRCNPQDLEAHVQTRFPTVMFHDLYKKGFQVLAQYCEDGKIDEKFEPLLKPLLDFLESTDTHEEALSSLKMPDFLSRSKFNYCYESVQSAVIANHLLSKLVDGEGYIMDSSKGMVLTCPCPVQGCKDQIHIGNTSIGYEKMWYGKLDIVLYPDGLWKTIVVTPADIDSEMNNDERTQIFELKAEQLNNLRKESTINQCIAQAITFSLYQANFAIRQPALNSKNLSIIPAICMSLTSYDIYMYDHINDVLLRNHGEPINLWQKNGTNLNVMHIIHIWMAINHIPLDARLWKEHINVLKDSCNFKTTCGDKFEIFKERVRFKSNFRDPKTPSAKETEFKIVAPSNPQIKRHNFKGMLPVSKDLSPFILKNL